MGHSLFKPIRLHRVLKYSRENKCHAHKSSLRSATCWETHFWLNMMSHGAMICVRRRHKLRAMKNVTMGQVYMKGRKSHDGVKLTHELGDLTWSKGELSWSARKPLCRWLNCMVGMGSLAPLLFIMQPYIWVEGAWRKINQATSSNIQGCLNIKGEWARRGNEEAEGAGGVVGYNTWLKFWGHRKSD